MSSAYSTWTGPARAMAVAVDTAVRAAHDADEAERVLRGCLTSAAPWYGFDANALLGAFTAAVGVDASDDGDDEASRPTPDAVLAHGVLLVSHLVAATNTALPEVLSRALSELRRAQTVELP